MPIIQDPSDTSTSNPAEVTLAMGQQIDEKTTGSVADAVERAKSSARSAVAAGRTYAAEAANAAGQRLGGAKEQVGRIGEQTSRYVNEQPMRAVGIAAAGGFLLAMALNVLRRGR